MAQTHLNPNRNRPSVKLRASGFIGRLTFFPLFVSFVASSENGHGGRAVSMCKNMTEIRALVGQFEPLL